MTASDRVMLPGHEKAHHQDTKDNKRDSILNITYGSHSLM